MIPKNLRSSSYNNTSWPSRFCNHCLYKDLLFRTWSSGCLRGNLQRIVDICSYDIARRCFYSIGYPCAFSKECLNSKISDRLFSDQLWTSAKENPSLYTGLAENKKYSVPPNHRTIFYPCQQGHMVTNGSLADSTSKPLLDESTQGA